MRLIAISSLLFVFVLFLQLFSGIYLFYKRYLPFFTEESIDKSLLSTVEVAFPHFLAMSITSFIVLHLFYFFKVKKGYFFLAGVVLVSSFMDILSGFLLLISKDFIYLKALSFSLFEVSFFTACFLLVILFIRRLKGFT